MKIRSNLRAGKGGSKSINNTVSSYVKPVNRCAGI